MPFLHTTDLLEILKARLESLLVDPADKNSGALFQRVGYFGSAQLADALKAVFAAESHVCFIVPAGDKHTNLRDRGFTFSQRHTNFAFLMADRVIDKTTQAALVGGKTAIGVLEMKDRVIDDLFANPFTEVDLALEPGEGDVLVIEQQPANLGRECYMQHFTAYAGSARRAIA